MQTPLGQVDNSIILVEDEHALAEEIIKFGAWSGLNIVHASNALSCLEHLRRSDTVNVIVTDVRLPDLSGIELLNTIRSEFSERHWLQFVILTGFPDLDIAQAAIRVGAVDLLSKPFDGKQFTAAVSKGILRSKKIRDSVDTHRAHEAGIRDTKLQSSPAVETNTLGAVAERVFKERAQRADLFSPELFSDPCWDMLMELFRSDLKGERLSTKGLCLASRVPISTALRRLVELEQRGFIERKKDHSDSRRCVVTLSDYSRDLLQKYFNRLHHIKGMMPSHGQIPVSTRY